MDEVENTKDKGEQTSMLAVVTLSIGIVNILVAALASYSSYHHIRGASEQFGIFCLILPFVSLFLGITALIHIGLSRGKVKGWKYAIVGMALAVISLAIIFITFMLTFHF